MKKIGSTKIYLSLLISVLSLAHGFAQNREKGKPNFVIIFTDDQGYGDLGCFGSQTIKTPVIDKMASEGAKLTSFYVAAPVCTPSRAALMTGSYPKRVDMAYGSNFAVLLAADSKGLNPAERTIAEVLKDAGYSTGIFGKWHLGDQPDFLPTRQGFDEFFGIPYSHDIHPFHPRQDHYNFPPLPLLEGEEVIEMEPDADYLTQRITERAVKFIEKNKGKPFFLYVPHPLPHHPLHVSPEFMEMVPDSLKAMLSGENESIDYTVRGGLYPHGISEIDWSVGQIMKTLKKLGLSENTLVVFTSDNGPDAGYGRKGLGSAGPLKGRKGTTFEGGMREPTVMYWPGVIPAGVSNDELMTTMDLLPTFAKLAGASLPVDKVLDGKDIFSTLLGKRKSPHKAFFYHRTNNLQAVRMGKWKLHVSKNKPEALYDLSKDIGESENVMEGNPKVVEKLLKEISRFEKELNQNSRPAAFVENPVALKK